MQIHLSVQLKKKKRGTIAELWVYHRCISNIILLWVNILGVDKGRTERLIQRLVKGQKLSDDEGIVMSSTFEWQEEDFVDLVLELRDFRE